MSGDQVDLRNRQDRLRNRRRAVVTATTAAALLLAALPGGTAGAAEPAKNPDRPGQSRSGVVGTVTLITGDRVSLDSKNQVVDIKRAPGRERIPVSVSERDGHIHAVPGDARLLLARGALDPRLFDVTALLADGYGDARRSYTPLIVTFRGRQAPSMNTFTEAGARVGRHLPAVNGTAMRATKKRGATWWEAITAGRADGRAAADFSTDTAVEKVWLDGRRRAALDRSTAQIGAPAAWREGVDGTGVEVAVLDTGIDKDHPDLAGRVTAEEDFTRTSGPGDRVGHGTHVASITAGAGTRSGGLYKGVAPGAKILNGKVLDDTGAGWDSDIIAGMEWAVEQGADVVNLSLAGMDFPGVDPMEEAVNRLSEQTDSLFVVAAGNEGDAEYTIGSPGSAAAALTVGAVDKDDKLARLSSRGPRLGDGSVKPDLTAPGIGITAAVAAGSLYEREHTGAPPGYASLSGTSMATPHVAGAAALLAQRHPDWDGEHIRSALTTSAEPGPYSSFQQGTGRVDVTRAMAQSVVADQARLDFGLQRWPHHDDERVTKELTYRNTGTRPVDLDLSVDARAVDGTSIPEGMFTVSPARLTVPAGGTATAEVTADTRLGTKDGSFGGSVAAVSADGSVRVRTAVGVERETEAYDLTVRHLDENGRPTGDGVTSVARHDRPLGADLADETDGESTVRLPAGDYSLAGVIHPGGDTNAFIVQPRLRLDADTVVDVDARAARPVRISLPDADTAARSASLTLMPDPATGRSKGWQHVSMPDFDGVTVGQLGPQLNEDEALLRYAGEWTRTDSWGKPVSYHLAYDRTGDLAGFTTQVQRDQLARVIFSAPAVTSGQRMQRTVRPEAIGDTLRFGHYTEFTLPTQTTDYILDSGIRWLVTGAMRDSAADPASESSLLMYPRTWKAGHTYVERFNGAVFGPGLPKAPEDLMGLNRAGATRRGNFVRAYLPLYNDGAGHHGDSRHSVSSTLHVDGKEIKDLYGLSASEGTDYEVPAEAGTYELALDSTRDPAYFPVSTRVSARWTFRSAETPEDRWSVLPLSTVRFTPELGPSGTAPAGARFSVPYVIEGAAAGRAPRALTFDVSYDEGTTWQSVPAGDGDHLSLTHPEKEGSVSLRVHLTDADGNSVVQTIERAYLTAR
jgi:subtilisin family serine protease